MFSLKDIEDRITLFNNVADDLSAGKGLSPQLHHLYVASASSFRHCARILEDMICEAIETEARDHASDAA